MTYDIVLFTDLIGRVDHLKTLGAYRIASELRQHGYTVKVVDYISRIIQNKELFTNILENLIGPNTLFVGWSSTFFDYGYGHENSDSRYPTTARHFSSWLSYIKKIAPHVKIVYGGYYAQPNFDLDNQIDYVVVGLADTMVVDLANHLKNKTPIKYTPSLTHSWKIIDYDKLGASFDFTTCRTKFEETDHVFPGETLPLETSRGCMFKCKFCSYPLLGRKKTDPAYHRTEDCLANELKYNWENFKVNRYIIVDDTFNETTGKLEAMLRARDAAGVDLELTAYLRIDLLIRFPEQLPLLRDLGFKAAFFGVESFNDRSAASIGKGVPSQKVKEMLYQVKEVLGEDFSTQIGLIVGLPHETPTTIAQTMSWIYSENSPVDYCNLNPLIVKDTLWGSDFAKDYAKYGYSLDENGEWFNDTWSYQEAQSIAKYWHNLGVEQGYQKMGNFKIFATASCGYDVKDLMRIKIKDIPHEQYNNDFDQRYSKYVNTIMVYEDIKYKKYDYNN